LPLEMDPDQQLRNERCVDSCAGKLIRSNHRLMGTYVQLMPKMVQRRMEEMESKICKQPTLPGPGQPGTDGNGPNVTQCNTRDSPLWWTTFVSAHTCSYSPFIVIEVKSSIYRNIKFRSYRPALVPGDLCVCNDLYV
uniref:Translocase of inner mitochondrial membrane 10B n=1 Tax=Nothobranchius furzeri TaxID=105023 RepID=A0A8C6PKQ4_NOTFU